MGEVTKTYTFASSDEGWTSFIGFETNGSVTDQSWRIITGSTYGLSNDVSLGNLGSVNCGWRITGLTFEDLGVPPGASVDYVTIDYDHMCGATSDPAHSVNSIVVMRRTSDSLYLVAAQAPEITYDFESTPAEESSTRVDVGGVASDLGIYIELVTDQQIDSPSGSGSSYSSMTECAVTIEYSEAIPTWVSPADTADAAPGDALVWTSFASSFAARFQVQVANDSGFSSGLVTYSSDTDSGFEYWDGAAWQTLNSARMPAAKTGNNARFTATSGFSGTKYRRVRQSSI